MEGLELNASGILSTITSIVSQNWPTIVAILGVMIGVSVVLKIIRKAAGR